MRSRERAIYRLVGGGIGVAGAGVSLWLALHVHAYFAAGIAGLFLLLMLAAVWVAVQMLRFETRLAAAPRRPGFACPSCHTGPPMGLLWQCDLCKCVFDTFETRAVCPQCAKHFPTTMCGECKTASPMKDWIANAQSANPFVSSSFTTK